MSRPLFHRNVWPKEGLRCKRGGSLRRKKGNISIRIRTEYINGLKTVKRESRNYHILSFRTEVRNPYLTVRLLPIGKMVVL